MMLIRSLRMCNREIPLELDSLGTFSTRLMSSKSSGGINVVGKRVFASLFSQTSDHDHDKYKLFCLCVCVVCMYPFLSGGRGV